MAHFKNLLLRDVLCKIVCFFEILYLFMLLWDFVSVETRGLGRSPSLGGTGGAEPAQPNQIITFFIYFKIVSFTSSDVF